MGFERPITIAKVIQGIQSNEYVLPAIQREFVWDAEQIEKLFDSLMRGYPIGSFLFWDVQPENLGEFQFYRFMDYYHQRDFKRNPQINLKGKVTGITAVLDGQQRLTALNIGLRGWYADKLPYYHWDSDHAFPERRLHLNLLEPAKDDMEFKYEFKMLREKDLLSQKDEKFWFPVSRVLDFKELHEVYDYCHQHELTQHDTTYPYKTLVKLWEITNKEPVINFFLEEQQDLDKVLNIFIRVNSGGTILSYSDMLLSIATAQWEEKDARQEIYQLVDELNDVGEGFEFNKDFVLKASLVLSDIPAIEFRVNNFNRENMLRIEDLWEKIKRALFLTAKLLASWGYSRQTLISNNAAIPLAYYLYNKGFPANFVESGKYKTDRDDMRQWLTIALLKRTFSGQADTVLRAVRRASQNHVKRFPAQSIYGELRGTNKSMTFDEAELEGLLAYQYHQSYTFSVLAMLYPWLKFNQHFHLDHIYPRSMFTERELAERGIPQEKRHQWLDHKDDLANLQLLQGLPNQEKSDQEFEAWVKDEHPTPQDLEHYRKNHLIPDVDLSFENYPVFLQAREEMIKERLREILTVKETLMERK
jgi:hypothetical protein